MEKKPLPPPRPNPSPVPREPAAHGWYHQYSPELLARFLKRLEGVDGKTDVAAKSMSIAPATIRVWRHRDKEFDRECQKVVEKATKEKP